MSAEIQAKVDLLARGFLARLEARLDAMAAALACCRSDPREQAAWDELHRLLHSLGGAAGSFGVPALGHAARALEAAIVRQQGEWQEAQIAAIESGLAGLRAWLPSEQAFNQGG